MFVLFCVVELYIHRDHMQIRHTILAPFLYLTYTTTQKTKTPATLTDLEYVSPITSIFHGPYWVIGKCYSESDLLFVDCTHGWCLLLPCSFAAAWQLICDSFIKYTYTCLLSSIQQWNSLMSSEVLLQNLQGAEISAWKEWCISSSSVSPSYTHTLVSVWVSCEGAVLSCFLRQCCVCALSVWCCWSSGPVSAGTGGESSQPEHTQWWRPPLSPSLAGSRGRCMSRCNEGYKQIWCIWLNLCTHKLLMCTTLSKWCFMGRELLKQCLYY